MKIINHFSHVLYGKKITNMEYRENSGLFVYSPVFCLHSLE